ncbi:hypothetical protein An15g03160 [Aspergillus niger]|uniref:Uncharacterized protein n=2 Tax=Aspergillus niger TaxID=5061 RepID=A2R596_ASPNC|nr:hypothetical protein An15g03160 [Aspergillus niger]CAK42391.1 hypothetical protein An15g03160 [Aspergillus niger]
MEEKEKCTEASSRGRKEEKEAWGAREKKREKERKEKTEGQKGTGPSETGPWFDNSTAAEQKEEEIDAGEMPIARDNLTNWRFND